MDDDDNNNGGVAVLVDDAPPNAQLLEIFSRNRDKSDGNGGNDNNGGEDNNYDAARLLARHNLWKRWATATPMETIIRWRWQR